MNFIIHSYAARFDQRICAVWLFSFIQLTNGSASKPIQSYLTNDKMTKNSPHEADTNQF